MGSGWGWAGTVICCTCTFSGMVSVVCSSGFILGRSRKKKFAGLCKQDLFDGEGICTVVGGEGYVILYHDWSGKRS